MFGDGSDSGSVNGSGAGLSGGFAGGNDSSCNSASLGGSPGSFGSPSANGGYGSPDGSGGIHSSLDGSSMAAPSGGSSTPNANSLGSQATNDASTQASTPSTSYASPQATNDNSSNPAGGFSNPQADTSGTPAGGPTGGFANDNSNDSTKTTGVSLDGSGFSGFSPNTTNDNTNTPTLNGAAGSSLSPSLGITGGTPYTNGFSFDSSTTTHDLSTITPNYDNEMNHYFNDTSGAQKTEGTLAKIDSAWDTVTQLADKYVVQPVQAAWNSFVPTQTQNTASIEGNVPSLAKQEVTNGFSDYKLDASAGNMLNPNPVATAANLGNMLNQNQIVSAPKEDGGPWQFSISPLGSADNSIGTVSAATESSLGAMRRYVGYSLSGMSRPNNIQPRIWNNNIASEITQFGTAVERLSTVARYTGYAGVGVGVGTGIYDNIQNGAVTEKIVSDAVVDTGFGLGGLGSSIAVGSILGTPFPVVGNLIGGLAGGTAYMVTTEMWQPGGRSIKDRTKAAAYNVIK